MNEPEILVSETNGLVQLHFGSDWVQGTMSVNNPWTLELEYLKDMLLPLSFYSDWQWPKRVLLIGLGAGSLTRFFLKNLKNSRVDVVEISPAVVCVCRSHFHLPKQSARFKLHISCGFDYLARKPAPYDLILVDAFDENADNYPFNTTQFYRLLYQSLTPMGGFAVNFHGYHQTVDAQFQVLADQFPKKSFLLSKTTDGNQVAIGFRNAIECPDAEKLEERLTQMTEKTNLDFTILNKKIINNQ